MNSVYTAPRPERKHYHRHNTRRSWTRPTRFSRREIRQELEFLAVAFQERLNPDGLDASLVVEQLLKLRRRCA